MYYVHQSVLNWSPILKSRCNDGNWINTCEAKVLPLPDVRSEIFDLLLSFLYSGDYEPTPIILNKKEEEGPASEFLDEATIMLSKHARLYSLGLKFQLTDLQALTVTKMRIESPIPLQSLLVIAEEVYGAGERFEGELSIGSFRDFLKAEASRAFQKSRGLTQEPWLANTLSKGGPLAVDLFQGLVDSTRNCESTTEEQANPDLNDPCRGSSGKKENGTGLLDDTDLLKRLVKPTPNFESSTTDQANLDFNDSICMAPISKKKSKKIAKGVGKKENIGFGGGDEVPLETCEPFSQLTSFRHQWNPSIQ